MKSQLTLLEGCVRQIEDLRGSTPAASTSPASRRVFVVHGHDEGAREGVARLLDRLGFKPIILRGQPNQGRTIIEKFEDYSDVGFAVVLLTPDDRGGRHDEPFEAQRPRARQNVWLELGFFLGKLGRSRVCALYRRGVEITSDYQGVVLEELDAGGAWKYRLAEELKAAGYDVDMNRVAG
jgi:predicted nucleotide-binding protein